MKRTIEVSTAGTHLSIKHNCLILSSDREQVASVPLEDLGTLILASQSLTVTSAVLGRLAEHGGITIVTGADHQPEGTLLPLRAHSTRGERVRAQVSASRPLEKQLWARIVRAKIRNQAALVPDGATRTRLEKLANSVRSGDPKNCEAQAARSYWPLVFSESHPTLNSEPFRRNRSGPWPNNLLNYGYAVLRAMTARAICAAGLLPELGIHHHSRYDPFALASDLMEPFRTWVDHRCLELAADGPSELTRREKQELLGVYDDPVMLDGQQTPLFVAVERAASGLALAFVECKTGTPALKATERLLLPSLPADNAR